MFPLPTLEMVPDAVVIVALAVALIPVTEILPPVIAVVAELKLTAAPPVVFSAEVKGPAGLMLHTLALSVPEVPK